MKKLRQLLLQRPIGYHYFLVLLSTILLLCCIGLNTRRETFFILTLLLSFLVLGTCLLYIWTWHQYTRYEYYGKRIRYEFNRIITRQRYKLERLSEQEAGVLSLLLNGYSLEKVAENIDISYEDLFKAIRGIKFKLEISSKESLLDINWEEAL